MATPSWMDKDFQLWYHEPRKVIHGILKNPDFTTAIDYIPYHEFQGGSVTTATLCLVTGVGIVAYVISMTITKPSVTSPRTSSQRIQICTGVCLSQSSSAPTKPQFQSLQANMNITLFICQLGASTTTSEVHIRTHSF